MTTTNTIRTNAGSAKKIQNRSPRIPVGLPPEIHALIKELAERNHRTIVGQIVHWTQCATAPSHDIL
jgi:hypothetical protein